MRAYQYLLGDGLIEYREADGVWRFDGRSMGEAVIYRADFGYQVSLNDHYLDDCPRSIGISVPRGTPAYVALSQTINDAARRVFGAV